jgi:Arc/MetJ-type ribon-helix-helix transcriptional regulator
MQSSISHENELFVQQEIADGAYQDRFEVLNAAVDLLRQQKQLVARLKESRRQLDSGEYTEFDGPGLRELFDDLKQRARAKAEPITE